MCTELCDTGYQSLSHRERYSSSSDYVVGARPLLVLIAVQQWAKFGEAQSDKKDGPDKSTTAIADEVFLTLTTNREVHTHTHTHTHTVCVFLRPKCFGSHIVC